LHVHVGHFWVYISGPFECAYRAVLHVRVELSEEARALLSVYIWLF